MDKCIKCGATEEVALLCGHRCLYPIPCLTRQVAALKAEKAAAAEAWEAFRKGNVLRGDDLDRHFRSDGKPCSLDALCINEPGWAANRIRVLHAELAAANERAGRLEGALTLLVSDLDKCPTRQRGGASGQTVENNMLATYITGLPVMCVERARKALDVPDILNPEGSADAE